MFALGINFNLRWWCCSNLYFSTEYFSLAPSGLSLLSYAARYFYKRWHFDRRSEWVVIICLTIYRWQTCYVGIACSVLTMSGNIIFKLQLTVVIDVSYTRTFYETLHRVLEWLQQMELLHFVLYSNSKRVSTITALFTRLVGVRTDSHSQGVLLHLGLFWFWVFTSSGFPGSTTFGRLVVSVLSCSESVVQKQNSFS